MGYDVHVHRKADFWDEDGVPGPFWVWTGHPRIAEVHVSIAEESHEPAGGGGLVTLTSTDDGPDTKKRVVHQIGSETSPGSGYFGQRKLQVTLTLSHLFKQQASACGDNGIQVHYAYLTEEADRDDDTDLSDYIRPPR